MTDPTRRPPPDTEASDFRFLFEELPIITDQGFSAGLVNGSAEISYWREDGYTQVCVRRIWLDGHRKATEAERANGAPYFITKPVEVTQEEQPWLYLAIFGQLDGEKGWRDLIEDEANERLGDAA